MRMQGRVWIGLDDIYESYTACSRYVGGRVQGVVVGVDLVYILVGVYEGQTEGKPRLF